MKITQVLSNPVSESYRLSGSPMHQGIVVALQSEFDGLRIKSPGVLLEISRVALAAAEKDRIDKEQKRVQPVGQSGDIHNDYPRRKS